MLACELSTSIFCAKVVLGSRFNENADTFLSANFFTQSISLIVCNKEIKSVPDFRSDTSSSDGAFTLQTMSQSKTSFWLTILAPASL